MKKLIKRKKILRILECPNCKGIMLRRKPEMCCKCEKKEINKLNKIITLIKNLNNQELINALRNLKIKC